MVNSEWGFSETEEGHYDAPRINDYRDLNVWKESMDLAVDIYKATKTFPREETFGMASQLRKSATSVPSNIAEGFGREQTKPFIQFLRIAQGSLKELETQVLIATRVDLIDQTTSSNMFAKTTSVGKMLRALIRSLSNRIDRGE